MDDGILLLYVYNKGLLNSLSPIKKKKKELIN